jgi:hypothetical protein
MIASRVQKVNFVQSHSIVFGLCGLREFGFHLWLTCHYWLSTILDTTFGVWLAGNTWVLTGCAFAYLVYRQVRQKQVMKQTKIQGIG